METYFSTMFEAVRHDRSSIILLPFTVSVRLKQSEFTDYETDKTKNFALEILHRQRMLK